MAWREAAIGTWIGFWHDWARTGAEANWSRKKWDAKARKVHLVGFEPTSKNFRLYDDESKKVFISCDVKFNEDVVQNENAQYWIESDENEDVEEEPTDNSETTNDTDASGGSDETTENTNATTSGAIDSSASESDKTAPKPTKIPKPKKANPVTSNYRLRENINEPRRYPDNEWGCSAIIDICSSNQIK